MKPPAIRNFPRTLHTGTSDSHQGERGMTMVLVAIAMVAIIAMAALSIDVITLYLAREEAQRSADAAALAAARVISLSGMTGDPNTPPSWGQICGVPLTSPATLAATAVATQSAVGGTVASVTVTYSAGAGTPVADCSTLPAGAFGVNPLVTVKITRSSLPTFFSRIWGNSGNTVNATAVAEVLNPSGSDNVAGNVIPVQPSCVKPWMVPNQNPNLPSISCQGAACHQLVTPADGSIVDQGIQPGDSSGVIGEMFNLFADCTSGLPCSLVSNPPQANPPTGAFNGRSAPSTPNLEFLPGSVSSSSVAVPSCGTSGTGGNADYLPAVAGCDQSTVYYCGVQSSAAITPNSIDLSENPGGATGDTATGVMCLTNQSAVGTANSGQDSLNTTGTPPYPYQILAGPANANANVRGDFISGSNSIMSLPIYDTLASVNPTGTTNVTIVGFLQVFVNYVNTDGSLNVTVMNVAGCGNGTTPTGRPVTGTSPVPIRLVTPP